MSESKITGKKRKTKMMYANIFALSIIIIIFIINLVIGGNNAVIRDSFLTLGIPFYGVLLIGGIFAGLVALGAAFGTERFRGLRRGNMSLKAYAIQIGIMNCTFAIISIITFNHAGEVAFLDYLSFGLWIISGIFTIISPFLEDNKSDLREI